MIARLLLFSLSCRGKGVRSLFCAAPFGPFREKAPAPFSAMGIVLLLAVFLVGIAERGKADVPALIAEAARTAQETRQNYRHVDPIKYPIGVFDSGTGGMAVLEAILAIDTFDNATRQPLPEGDGQPDLACQSFIYLADQANMPYGNYPNVGREGFLEQLAVKDAEFLLTDRYYPDADSDPARDKLPVKAVVIACNTATAYGKGHIEKLVAATGLDIPVVGVVDAGVRGALDLFADGQSGTIGILATRATVLAEAYPRAIRAEIAHRRLERDGQRIMVVQQGSLGLAGAIDGAEELILHGIQASRPRGDYQGPSLNHPFAAIDRGILARYAFDFSNYSVLFDGPREKPTAMQLNSVANYLRYDVVSLLESLRQSPDPQPLRAIILACTHFPYFTEAFERELQRLANYQEDGVYIYRDYLAPQVELIDPAYFAARELYVKLADGGKLAPAPAEERSGLRSPNGPEGASQERPPRSFLQQTRGEFYITVPNRRHPDVRLSAQGHFTYEYKYSPHRPEVGADYRAVPLRYKQLDAETADRLRGQVPLVWELLDEFNRGNKKAAPGN
ncbi:MAG: aspartate/glutamate racemase family protein [Thermoguttaceae bacterium]|jgi:glutamate racemase|nr:aspartate/glutamate racemase family protein [Thermoguttaceae bacterium]